MKSVLTSKDSILISKYYKMLNECIMKSDLSLLDELECCLLDTTNLIEDYKKKLPRLQEIKEQIDNKGKK